MMHSLSTKLDNATGPLKLLFYFFQDPRVLDAMLPYSLAYYGNPHSRTHAYGWESEAAVEKARGVR
jgi:selenocysteine lyase/cysteine desulfurase